jgi:hypothetical protein
MNNQPRYDFYEKVIVAAPGKAIDGERGAVLGRVEHDDGTWGYAVHIYSQRICWSLGEDELLPTGEFDVRATFYDGTTVQVEVDSRGRGHIR